MGEKKIFKPRLDLILPLRDAIYEHTRSYTNIGSDYSVTELIKPPRIVQLEKRYRDYFDTLPIDSDFIEKNLSSFRGNAIHDRFERMLWRHINKHPEKGYLVERRIWDRICGRKVSGKFDCFLNKVMYDFKTTTVWKKIFGDYSEWIEQLNIYDYLCALSHIEIEELRIIAWYMDWDKYKVYEIGYPKIEIEEISIKEKWEQIQQQRFLEERIELHKANEKLADDELIPCSGKEMWEKPEKWAVYEVGNDKKAKRVLDLKEEADTWMKEWLTKNPKKAAKIVHRPGERLRCKEYCRCNIFCNIWYEHTGGEL